MRQVLARVSYAVCAYGVQANRVGKRLPPLVEKQCEHDHFDFEQSLNKVNRCCPRWLGKIPTPCHELRPNERQVPGKLSFGLRPGRARDLVEFDASERALSHSSKVPQTAQSGQAQ